MTISGWCMDVLRSQEIPAVKGNMFNHGSIHAFYQ
jgi:hypothetical protein